MSTEVENAQHRKPVEYLEHVETIACPGDAAYDILADVHRWPVIFPPTVHVQRLSVDGARERIRVVARAADSVKSWESERMLDRPGRQITFRQVRSQHPVAFMSGTWKVRDDGPGRCRVVLGHEFAATGPEHQVWLRQVVDENSRRELTALRTALEPAGAAEDPRVLDFTDSVVVDAPPEQVFGFVNDAHLWADRLPHVAEVRLNIDEAGVQDLAMITCSPDGSRHRTRSYRVVVPDGAIVYKQFTLPPLMSTHIGRWEFLSEPGEDGRTVASSRHIVVLDTARIEEVLGAGTDLAGARATVREALGANSRATLALAKAHAEGH